MTRCTNRRGARPRYCAAQIYRHQDDAFGRSVPIGCRDAPKATDLPKPAKASRRAADWATLTGIVSAIAFILGGVAGIVLLMVFF